MNLMEAAAPAIAARHNDSLHSSSGPAHHSIVARIRDEQCPVNIHGKAYWTIELLKAGPFPVAACHDFTFHGSARLAHHSMVAIIRDEQCPTNVHCHGIWHVELLEARAFAVASCHYALNGSSESARYSRVVLIHD